MHPFTRRRALQGAVGLFAGLAGCNDLSGPGSDPPTGTPTMPRGGGDQTVAEPESVSLRADDYQPDERIAWFVPDAEARRTDGETVKRADRERESLVTDRETADSLVIAEESVVETEVSESPETVRAFLAETDFDSESVLVQHRSVGACYRLELCYVTWTDGEVEPRYGQFLRGHDVACEANTRHTHITFARLPTALDPETAELGATGVSRGECFVPPPERRRRVSRDETSTGDTPVEAAQTTVTPTGGDG
ncbi:hypothetical protein BRC79_03915 [Halobacteriales archaeon QH_8_67_27]|nr:MAG: hypothetical protein BRC79_03915 [Halobacteriales archaeon QH_8_67_27]